MKIIIENFKLFDRKERYSDKVFSPTRKNIKNLIKLFVCNIKIYVYIYFLVYNLRYTLKIKSTPNRLQKNVYSNDLIPSFESLSKYKVYEIFQRLKTVLVYFLWMDSRWLISFFKYGDQIGELYSNLGRM